MTARGVEIVQGRGGIRDGAGESGLDTGSRASLTRYHARRRGRSSWNRAEKTLVNPQQRDRLMEKADGGRRSQVIWEIPLKGAFLVADKRHLWSVGEAAILRTPLACHWGWVCGTSQMSDMMGRRP